MGRQRAEKAKKAGVFHVALLGGLSGSAHCASMPDFVKARILLAVLVLSLQACAAVPLSTMVRMSSFSERDFPGPKPGMEYELRLSNSPEGAQICS